MSALPFNLPVERTAYGVRSLSRLFVIIRSLQCQWKTNFPAKVVAHQTLDHLSNMAVTSLVASPVAKTVGQPVGSRFQSNLHLQCVQS